MMDGISGHLVVTYNGQELFNRDGRFFEVVTEEDTDGWFTLRAAFPALEYDDWGNAIQPA
jgi:hypothetical protein